VPPASTLRLASWNLEFLAAADGSGCNPRTAADYAAMRAVVDSLNADVIAFEEAESVEAASRVFDPAHYTVVMEARPGRPGGACSAQQPNQIFIRQAVGFAIRRGLSFVRAPDLTELEVGNANLRSGVDITVTPKGGMPLRLLAVHLKSGCFEGTTGTACPQLLKQIPVVAKWIDEAAAGPTRFAVLGDWNRRLGLPGDAFWATIDDASPPNADLRLADERVAPRCDPKFTAFIDHIVLDKRAGAQFLGFKETTFPQGRRPSDHCPIVADLRR
jgi:endonuclease/exonuclease/phosphatase family metal-dependent hydrolase